MELMLGSALFLLAGGCAALMGFAIQRGATCAVAAVDEVVRQRQATRLVALLEASLWVAAGLALAQHVHWLSQAPVSYSFSPWTMLGGVLLGAGAFVNRACVFGAIARLGSGEWAYLATPAGFYVGCLSAGSVFAAPQAMVRSAPSPVLAAPLAVMGVLGAALLARAAWARRPAPRSVGAGAEGRATAAPTGRWTPHAATRVIGLSFLALLLISGAWAYTDVLAELARGMSHSLAVRVALLVFLLAGAVAGGWSGGRLAPVPAAPRALARCFAGGVLMGWGSLLIPGGNDGLILVGMPLLQPYAWAAFATMCATIAGAMLATRRWSQRGG